MLSTRARRETNKAQLFTKMRPRGCQEEDDDVSYACRLQERGGRNNLERPPRDSEKNFNNVMAEAEAECDETNRGNLQRSGLRTFVVQIVIVSSKWILSTQKKGN